MSDDLMRRMRDHVGYDPDQVLAHPERYSRTERRAAARVLAKKRPGVVGQGGEQR